MSDLMCPVRVLCIREEAAEDGLSERLRTERVAVVYSSRLPSARQTADRLAQDLGTPVTADERLGGEQMTAVLAEIADLYRGETVVVVTASGVLVRGLTMLSPDLTPRWVSQHPVGTSDVIDMSYDSGGWRCASWAGVVPE